MFEMTRPISATITVVNTGWPPMARLFMKEKAGMSSRCIPFTQEKLGEVCACCGKPAKHMIYWGVAY